MDSELVKIVFPISCVFLLGVVMFVGSRWSRKKSEEFQKTDAAKAQRNALEGEPILEQLKSKETWDKVKDGMAYHDPRSDKAKAIRNDVIGTLGTVPFVITALIAVVMMVLFLFN